MPAADPADYQWVAASESSYHPAGCVTVVSGLEVGQALKAVGAGVTQEAHEADRFADTGMAAIAAVALEGADPAVVLIEDNGFEGTRPEVLKALSKKGAAASAFWNVNGVVRFSCARRGKFVYSDEVPAFDDVAEAPRALRKLLASAEGSDVDPVAVAAAMVVTFTGVELLPDDEVSRPHRFYPIVNPVLGLPVTHDELVGLRYPTPELVAAVQAAPAEARWRLLEWAASDAVAGTGLGDHQGVADVIAGLGDGPVVLTPAFLALRNEVERALSVASNAVQDAYNSYTTAEEKARLGADATLAGRRHWAMQALVYTSVADSVTAALGATYCATIRYGLGSEAAAGFHARALEVVTAES